MRNDEISNIWSNRVKKSPFSSLYVYSMFEPVASNSYGDIATFRATIFSVKNKKFPKTWTCLAKKTFSLQFALFRFRNPVRFPLCNRQIQISQMNVLQWIDVSALLQTFCLIFGKCEKNQFLLRNMWVKNDRIHSGCLRTNRLLFCCSKKWWTKKGWNIQLWLNENKVKVKVRLLWLLFAVEHYNFRCSISHIFLCFKHIFLYVAGDNPKSEFLRKIE